MTQKEKSKENKENKEGREDKEKSEKKEDIEYWKKEGDKFFKEGKYVFALEAYETIAKTDPKNVEAWKGMATTFSLMNKPYEALESLDKAIEIDPTDMDSLEIRSLILKKLLEENEEQLNRLKAKQSEKSNKKLI